MTFADPGNVPCEKGDRIDKEGVSQGIFFCEDGKGFVKVEGASTWGRTGGWARGGRFRGRRDGDGGCGIGGERARYCGVGVRGVWQGYFGREAKGQVVGG